MADKSIGALPAASELNNDSLIPVEQGGIAMSISGAQIAEFAKQSAESRVQDAERAAKNAAASAEAAAASKSGIDESLEAARQSAREAAASATQADRAKQTIIDLGVSASASDPGEAATVEKTVDASGNITLTFRIPRGIQGPMGTITSIVKTSGTGEPGTTDTYTITCSDGSTAEFSVYNGKDGTGTGDMERSTYDPTGKAQDIFKYVDDRVASIKTTYDPKNKEQDIFAYVDSQIEASVGVALGGSY